MTRGGHGAAPVLPHSFVNTFSIHAPLPGCDLVYEPWGCMMQTLAHSYRGLGLLVRLNWDRALAGSAILGALTAGAWLATL